MNNISVTITPTTAGLIKQERIQRATTLRNTVRFYAVVENDPVDAGVLWEMYQGGGEMTQQGIFIPPYDRALGKSTVCARSVTDRSKFATAIVTYTDS